MARPRRQEPYPWNDPSMIAWAEHVRVELIPMIYDADVSLSIVPDDPAKTDIKFAVELGLSIMFDKPIVLLVRPGTQLPDRLVRVADHVVEWSPEMSNEDLIKRLDEVLG